jgi:5-oxopent-3-ene-1,2,5-tricarboxylate decarboxylase / 2-hydroxyhepta-2,4-diene-1,7-dioate isomerase
MVGLECKVRGMNSIPFTGTVYGVLLNGAAEWQSALPLMHSAPYQAPPQAPVLYVKTANTWSANESRVVVPDPLAELEIGATLSAVMGPSVAGQPRVSHYVLLNDWSVPHSAQEQGFYRPPVKYKCLDGFLGIGSQTVSASALPTPNQLELWVQVNGTLVQRIHLQTMRQHSAQLLDRVSEFMRLDEGDVLMLGLDVCTENIGEYALAGLRPRARRGDRIEISAPAMPALGVLRQQLESA